MNTNPEEELNLTETPPVFRLSPGRFWRRFAAAVIDNGILGVFSFVLSMPLYIFVGIYFAQQELSLMDVEGITRTTNIVSVISYFYTIPMYIAYAGYFYSRFGTTPGKRLMNLRVINPKTGMNLSFWQAGLRDTLGKLISLIPIFLGYLMILFKRDKRALHDLIFDSQVFHTPST